MSALPQPFTHDAFGEIRGFARDGNPWFVAKDIAQALAASLHFTTPNITTQEKLKDNWLTPATEFSWGGYCNADGKRGSGTRVFRRFPETKQWTGQLEILIFDAILTEKEITKAPRRQGACRSGSNGWDWAVSPRERGLLRAFLRKADRLPPHLTAPHYTPLHITSQHLASPHNT